MWTGLIAIALLGAVLIWLLRGRSHGEVASPRSPDLTYEEMEAEQELREAEEEVRDLESGAQPDDERTGDDWGPGTSRSY